MLSVEILCCDKIRRTRDGKSRDTFELTNKNYMSIRFYINHGTLMDNQEVPANGYIKIDTSDHGNGIHTYLKTAKFESLYQEEAQCANGAD